jgi:hypothetical protein
MRTTRTMCCRLIQDTDLSTGANVGATRANDFPRQANECGQASGDHASSRTHPDDAERHAGIYGSESWSSSPSEPSQLSPVQAAVEPVRPELRRNDKAAPGQVLLLSA